MSTTPGARTATAPAPLAPTDDSEREAQQSLLAQQLDAFGITLAESRSAAISARQSSGIEIEWTEDEEFYEGIDDSNRGEHANWRTKPPGMSSEPIAKDSTASTVFVNITRPYADAASARVADMLLPTDDRGWTIKPTPVPELIGMKQGQLPSALAREIARNHPGDPQAAKAEAAIAVKAALEVMAEAQEKADKAQKRIEDWHIECQFHAEMRSVIEDTSRAGTGVLKGPIPEKRRQVVYNKQKNALEIKAELKPGSRRVSYWNLYPDPACGENIHNGSFVWERDDIARKQLEALRGVPGYIDFQIDACLREGPSKATKEVQHPEPNGTYTDKGDQYEIWYFHGNLTPDQLDAFGVKVDEEERAKLSLPAVMTMVNNHVIKAALNPLDTGEFPYDVMVWQKRAGFWAGIGVSRQIRTPQRIVNGAARMMMDNTGRAGGPQLVIKQGVVTPHDGKYVVTPWKVWIAGEDSDLEHLDNAFRFITIPSLEKELMEIVQFGLKLAEDVTGLPLLLQGQQGKAPETVGGMQMLNNNASTVLRRVARLYDDRITEPHVRRYYAYLLQYGEDDEKGEYVIDARGSSALVERDLQNQAVGQMANMVENPVFGLDPKKWAKQWLKSQRLNPADYEFDDEEWQKIVENMKRGSGDPRLAVAQLNNEMKGKIRQLELAFDEREKAKDRELDLILATVQERLQGMKIQGEREISFDELRAMLADTVIKVRAQKELSVQDHVQSVHREALKPPTEPAGRAAPGHSFQG
jgi:hypothetical protein